MSEGGGLRTLLTWLPLLPSRCFLLSPSGQVGTEAETVVRHTEDVHQQAMRKKEKKNRNMGQRTGTQTGRGSLLGSASTRPADPPATLRARVRVAPRPPDPQDATHTPQTAAYFLAFFSSSLRFRSSRSFAVIAFFRKTS